MADIDRIVSVSITRQTTAPSVASFNGMLIADAFLKSVTTPSFDERVREYGSLAEVVADGFATTSFVYRAASKAFAQSPAPKKIYVGRKLTGGDGTESWATAVAALAAASSAWYYLIASTRTLVDQEAIADWAEANKKIYVTSAADANMVDATSGDIAAYLHTNNLDRSVAIYHPEADGDTGDPVIEAALVGKMSVKQPGSATWAFKSLKGIAAYALTAAQITKLSDKNGNFYTTVAGVDIMQMGTVGSGEYIDVITGLDWLQANIQNKVYTPLVNQDKIVYTDGGIDGLNSQLKSALQDAVVVGLLSSYSTTVPKVADIASSEKVARNLPDVSFLGTLAGAIHKTQIAGIVSY